MDLRNTQIITGHLGQDPVVKTVKVKGSDKTVTEGSLAVTPRGRDEPNWHKFEIWGETPAKIIGNMKKGEKLQVVGAHIYDEVDGKRYYKIIAEGFEVQSRKAANSDAKKENTAA